MDLRISYYGRYVDDTGSLASSKEAALQLVESISAQDPDGLLKWELDFPENKEQFTPFLDTQIKIDENGTRLENACRLSVRPVVIDDRRDPVVRAEGEKFRLELVTLSDIDTVDFVGKR